jgi:hypothetical protein
MTMEQAAKLGLFIIKFIDDMRLDFSVGFDSECLPQVVYIPDVIDIPEEIINYTPKSVDEWLDKQEEALPYLDKHPIKELSHDETNQLLNEVASKISSFNSLFTQGHFKL